MRITTPIYGGKRGGVLGYRVVRDDERDLLRARSITARAALDGIVAVRREGRYNTAEECREIAREALRVTAAT